MGLYGTIWDYMGLYGTPWDYMGLHGNIEISDGCKWIVFGLVTPQDGLVMPPLWELRADLFKKRPKFVKIVNIPLKKYFGGFHTSSIEFR